LQVPTGVRLYIPVPMTWTTCKTIRCSIFPACRASTRSAPNMSAPPSIPCWRRPRRRWTPPRWFPRRPGTASRSRWRTPPSGCGGPGARSRTCRQWSTLRNCARPTTTPCRRW